MFDPAAWMPSFRSPQHCGGNCAGASSIPIGPSGITCADRGPSGAHDMVWRTRIEAPRSLRHCEGAVMDMDPAIRDAMVAAIPRLRKFAISLAGVQQADDLVQETLLQACSKIRLFNPTSQMLPWLITILRNQFYSQYRKR